MEPPTKWTLHNAILMHNLRVERHAYRNSEHNKQNRDLDMTVAGQARMQALVRGEGTPYVAA